MNMRLEMPLYRVLFVTFGVASLPCLLIFQTSKIYASILAFIAYIKGEELGVVWCTRGAPSVTSRQSQRISL